MIRHFNRTGRKRIQRSHAVVTLRRWKSAKVADTDGDHCFDLRLELGGYGFPPNARLRVEAWRGSAFQRWKWGTVGRPGGLSESERVLRDVPETCRFRLAVVEAGGSGRLLGLADKLSPRLPAESILPLVVSDLGSEVWRLDFGEGDDIAVLRVNSRMPGLSETARNDPVFRALVMPQVLRCVLERALLVERESPDDAEGRWKAWFDLARDVMPEQEPPVVDYDAQEDQIARADRWIRDVTAAFAQKKVRAMESYRRAKR